MNSNNIKKLTKQDYINAINFNKNIDMLYIVYLLNKDIHPNIKLSYARDYLYFNEMCDDYKKPTTDDLLTRLNKYTIKKENLPIQDNKYFYGHVLPKKKLIVLNEKNHLQSNIETISHELLHVWYDYENKMNLSEIEIEKRSQEFLKDKVYYKCIEDRLK